MSRRFFPVATMAATLALLHACSSDDRPGGPDLGGGGPTTSGGGGGSSSGSSARSDGGGSGGSSSGSSGAADAAACTDLPLGGAGVQERQFPGGAPPPFGGTITPGTYELSDRVEYEGTEASVGKVALRGTIVVTATLFQRRVSDGTTDKSTADTYKMIETNTLELTGICPEPSLRRTLSFSAQPSNLTLYLDPTHAETYTLQ